jgi:hypothetical protein
LHQGQTRINHRAELSRKHNQVFVGKTRPQTNIESARATFLFFKTRNDNTLLAELIHRLISGFRAQLALLDGTRSRSSDIRKGSHTQHSPFDVAIAWPVID